MPRKQRKDTQKGKIFVVEWPEYHLNCAVEDCTESILVTLCGEAMTAKAALKNLKAGKTEDESEGWQCRDGLWYCPQCGGTGKPIRKT